MKHLFDGFGMLACFEFDNGKVSSMQRYANVLTEGLLRQYMLSDATHAAA